MQPRRELGNISPHAGVSLQPSGASEMSLGHGTASSMYPMSHGLKRQGHEAVLSRQQRQREEEAKRVEDKRLQMKEGLASLEVQIDSFLMESEKEPEAGSAEARRREIPQSSVSQRERLHLYRELARWVDGASEEDILTGHSAAAGDHRGRRIEAACDQQDKSLAHLDVFQQSLKGMVGHCMEALKLAQSASKGKAAAESRLALLHHKLELMQRLAEESPVEVMRDAITSRDATIRTLKRKEQQRKKDSERLKAELSLHRDTDRGHGEEVKALELLVSQLRHESASLKRQIRVLTEIPREDAATCTVEDEEAPPLLTADDLEEIEASVTIRVAQEAGLPLLSADRVKVAAAAAAAALAKLSDASTQTDLDLAEVDADASADLPGTLSWHLRGSPGGSGVGQMLGASQRWGGARSGGRGGGNTPGGALGSLLISRFYAGLAAVLRASHSAARKRHVALLVGAATQRFLSAGRRMRRIAALRAELKKKEAKLQDTNSILRSVQEALKGDTARSLRLDKEALLGELEGERAKRMVLQREHLEASEASVPAAAFNEIAAKVSDLIMSAAGLLARERRTAVPDDPHSALGSPRASWRPAGAYGGEAFPSHRPSMSPAPSCYTLFANGGVGGTSGNLRGGGGGGGGGAAHLSLLAGVSRTLCAKGGECADLIRSVAASQPRRQPASVSAMEIVDCMEDLEELEAWAQHQQQQAAPEKKGSLWGTEPCGTVRCQEESVDLLVSLRSDLGAVMRGGRRALSVCPTDAAPGIHRGGTGGGSPPPPPPPPPKMNVYVSAAAQTHRHDTSDRGTQFSPPLSPTSTWGASAGSSHSHPTPQSPQLQQGAWFAQPEEIDTFDSIGGSRSAGTATPVPLPAPPAVPRDSCERGTITSEPFSASPVLPTLSRTHAVIAGTLGVIETLRAAVAAKPVEFHRIKLVRAEKAVDDSLCPELFRCISRRVCARAKLSVLQRGGGEGKPAELEWRRREAERLAWVLFDCNCEQVWLLRRRVGCLRAMLERGSDEEVDRRFVVIPNNARLHQPRGGGGGGHPLVINPSREVGLPGSAALQEFLEVKCCQGVQPADGGVLTGYTTWDKACMLRQAKRAAAAAVAAVVPHPPPSHRAPAAPRPASAGGGGGGGGGAAAAATGGSRRQVRFSRTVVTDSPQHGGGKMRKWQIPALRDTVS